MGDLILAGLLLWLTIFVWWGTNLALRPGGRGKVIGTCLIVLALIPSGIAIWLNR